MKEEMEIKNICILGAGLMSNGIVQAKLQQQKFNAQFSWKRIRIKYVSKQKNSRRYAGI